jgi:exopolysaccharide biosynthesis polyprenyl glycosylphosphotransferase
MNIKIQKSLFYDIVTILTDILFIVLASFLSYEFLKIFIKVEKQTSGFMMLFIGCMIFMLYTYEFYTKLIRKRYEVVLSVCISTFISTVVVLAFQSIFNSALSQYNGLFYCVNMVLTIFCISFEKLIFLEIIKLVKGAARLLIIELKEIDNSLARKIKYSYSEIYDAWYLQIDCNNQEEVEDVIHNKFPEYDSIFLSPLLPDDIRNLFISNAVSQKKEIYVLPDLYNISVMKNEMVSFDDTPALRIRPFGLTNFQTSAKRAFDVICSIIGIIVTSPIMLICAALIKLDSKGPALYRQERMTIDQKKFKMYKFRTMFTNAEKHTGAVLASEDDPRITKVGKVLRSLRLDELPQLFNIFTGSMSVVGPRPERPVFVEEYINEIENYDKRFFVKAGLTGLAQIYGRYSTSPKYKTLYDLLYVKDYSFWIDIKIILLTIKIMFVKESSDGVGAPVDYSKKNMDIHLDI